MKRIFGYILITMLFFTTAKVSAQQMPYYTQFMFNEYLINPGVAGTHNFVQLRANSRIQWLGMDDAPRTMSFSMYGPWKDKSMGYGGSIFHDDTGPDSRTAINLTYAYNIALTDFIRISGGITFGLMQYKFDGSGIYIGDEVGDDPVFNGSVESEYIPDASIGIYLYSTAFYAGIAAHQLFGNKLELYETVDTISNDETNQLKQHYYLTGGYHFVLNRDWIVQPSILFKTMFPNQYQFELNAKVTWQRMVWLGLTYRTSDALAVMAGYNYQNRIYIGLSYDITYSDLRRYTGGTFEVMIGVRFNKIK